MANKQSSLPGIGFMIVNTIALSVLDICSKTLGHHLPSSLIVFFYKFTLLLITAPWIFSEGLKHIKTNKMHVHLVRGLFSALGSLFFVSGLKYVKIADAAALENIQYILIAIVGMLFFNEGFTKSKMVSIIVGFIGAILIVKPDAFSNGIAMQAEFNFGYVYILLAISCWALNSISVKLLGMTESNKTQLFYLFLISSVIAGFSSFITWKPVQLAGYAMPIEPMFTSLKAVDLHLNHFLLLATMAAMYFTHGVAYFKALKHELSIVIPFRYTKLIFSGLFGYFIFNEVPAGQMTYLGYTLVTISSLILVQYEIKKRRRARRELEALAKADAQNNT